MSCSILCGANDIQFPMQRGQMCSVNPLSSPELSVSSFGHPPNILPLAASAKCSTSLVQRELQVK